jgi:hypothetical protein
LNPWVFIVLWLVVVGGVEGELAEEFAGSRVDDLDVEVLDEHQDGGSGVGSPDSDVVLFSVVSAGEFPVAVDLVGNSEQCAAE